MRWSDALAPAILASAAALEACNAISGVGDLRFGEGAGGEGSTSTAASTAESAAQSSSTAASSSTTSSTGPSSSSAASSSAGASGGGGAGAGPHCGDGAVEPPETCDDGNAASGDGCSGGCDVECDGPGEVQDPATQRCYLYIAPPGDWATHQAACVAWRAGANLAVVRSAAEATFVAANDADLPQLWLAAHNGGSGSVFKWLDGEPFDYEPWSAGQPNNPDVMACLAFDGGVTFVDIPCTTADVSAVCEYPLP